MPHPLADGKGASRRIDLEAGGAVLAPIGRDAQQTVRDWLGHRNIQNTLVYAKLTNPTRDAEVGRAMASRKIAT